MAEKYRVLHIADTTKFEEIEDNVKRDRQGTLFCGDKVRRNGDRVLVRDNAGVSHLPGRLAIASPRQAAQREALLD